MVSLKRITVLGGWAVCLLSLASVAEANPWHRAHYYGVTNRCPRDVWDDLQDAYNSPWARHDYQHWFGYDCPVYLRGCPGQCGFTPTNYRGFAPAVLTGPSRMSGASWYNLPQPVAPSPAP